MFVQVADFNVLPYNIPNLTKKTEILTPIIAQEEEKELYKVLGYPLAKAFYDGLALGSPEQRWLDMRGEKEYTDPTDSTGKKYYWSGMRVSLKGFIFHQWVNFISVSLGDGGYSEEKIENADTISPRRQVAAAWTDYAKKIGGKCNKWDTLYGFLYCSGDTYLDVLTGYTSIQEYLCARFKAPGVMNFMGL